MRKLYIERRKNSARTAENLAKGIVEMKKIGPFGVQSQGSSLRRVFVKKLREGLGTDFGNDMNHLQKNWQNK